MPVHGKLYLIPVPISDAPLFDYIPQFNSTIVSKLRNFIAEDAKTARRFLKAYNYPSLPDAEIMLLNEHTGSTDFANLLKPLMDGHDLGLMSDAGCPGVADPGAEVVKLAHQKNIQVIPLVGPSSILLSIMASGFNGQNFSFNGYLPVDKVKRQERIRQLEQLAIRQQQAQFFIETPYRNDQLFEALIQTLKPSTSLFIGKDITAPSQFLKSKTVGEWQKAGKVELHKVPVVFGIFA